MIFKFALGLGMAGVVTASVTSFSVDCDHLQVTDNGQCVGTRLYGNDHDCTITVNGVFTLDVISFHVEEHSDCGWDYLRVGGTRYCSNSPDGVTVTDGATLHWHTDSSVTRGGWKVCANRNEGFSINPDGSLMYLDGYVCDDNFATDEAKMVCATLGLNYATHGDINVPDQFTMDNLDCETGATALSDCDFYTVENCFSHEGVRLQCTAEDPSTLFSINSDGALMFAGGYVCDDNFGADEAAMVCATMGLELESFGDIRVTDNFSMDDLDCPEGATSLNECTYHANENCFANEGVRLECTQPDYKFDIGDCDHLEVVHGGTCVGTRMYGNNHDCTITALGDFGIQVEAWSVEEHSGCSWDYFAMPNGKRYCTDSPQGEYVREGEMMTWHTDYSETRDGWLICADEEATPPTEDYRRMEAEELKPPNMMGRLLKTFKN